MVRAIWCLCKVLDSINSPCLPSSLFFLGGGGGRGSKFKTNSKLKRKANSAEPDQKLQRFAASGLALYVLRVSHKKSAVRYP